MRSAKRSVAATSAAVKMVGTSHCPPAMLASRKRIHAKASSGTDTANTMRRAGLRRKAVARKTRQAASG